MLKPKITSTPAEELDQFYINAKNMVRQGGLLFLETTEPKFGCAGICSTPLFYATQDIGRELPTESCSVSLIVSKYSDLKPLGVLIFVLGIFLFTLLVCSCFYCMGSEADKAAKLEEEQKADFDRVPRGFGPNRETELQNRA